MSAAKALKLKDAGNQAFKAGNLNAAVGAYTYSLETLEQALKSTNETKNEVSSKSANISTEKSINRLRAEILSNRSLCLSKLGEHKDSLNDAKSAIASDSSFGKAYLRYGQALYALKNFKGAIEQLENALKVEPEKLAKQVSQLIKKCRKMISKSAPATSSTSKSKSDEKATSTSCTASKATKIVTPPADVHTFARQLVTAALSCGVADPNNSKFEGAHLILSMIDDKSEKRVNVSKHFEKYKRIQTLAGRSRYLMNIVRTEIVGFAILPHDFEIAKHLLRPRLFSRQKLDATGSTAMPENDELPCWMVGDESSTTSGQIKQTNSVAVAVVVDYGKDGMLPVMSSTCAAWKVSFDTVRSQALSNFCKSCVKQKKKEWESHMSGCLTSPWKDNTDGARVALFPEMYVPNIPLMEGQPKRSSAPETVAIFGTNNCVLISDASNPISQCFIGDIVINDMEKTVDHVSSVPYRLVRSNGTGAPWAWRPYCPTVQKIEFSVPSSQTEIDSILDAVQGGGKKQIPIFGETETKKQTIQKNVQALVQKAKETEKIEKKNMKNTKAPTKTSNTSTTKLRGGFLDNETTKKKSVLNDKRTKDQEKKKKQILSDSKSVNGLNQLSGKEFFKNQKSKIVKDILIEASSSFDGPREGCVFRHGDLGVGYYKDVPKVLGEQVCTTKTVERKANEPTIDLATLNRSIGMYGNLSTGNIGGSSPSSLFGGSSSLLQKKSLFSL